jgi:hypothetical protein
MSLKSVIVLAALTTVATAALSPTGASARVRTSEQPAPNGPGTTVTPVARALTTKSAESTAPVPPKPIEIGRVVAADRDLRLDFLYSINPDCTSVGYVSVQIVEQPKHGSITIENSTGFTNFPAENPRAECNKRRSDGVALAYKPEPGYTGPDSADFDVITPNGFLNKRHYTIEVRSAAPAPSIATPAPGGLGRPVTLVIPESTTTGAASAAPIAPKPVEIARVVAADQDMRLDFVTVRILEQPKHGSITIENSTGFTNFPATNLRAECNKRRSDGVAVIYKPEPAYMGLDTVDFDVINPDGTLSKRHYTIEVR